MKKDFFSLQINDSGKENVQTPEMIPQSMTAYVCYLSLPCYRSTAVLFFCTILAGCFKRFFKSGKLFAEIKEYKAHSLLKSNNKFNRPKMSVFYWQRTNPKQNRRHDSVCTLLTFCSIHQIDIAEGKKGADTCKEYLQPKPYATNQIYFSLFWLYREIGLSILKLESNCSILSDFMLGLFHKIVTSQSTTDYNDNFTSTEDKRSRLVAFKRAVAAHSQNGLGDSGMGQPHELHTSELEDRPNSHVVRMLWNYRAF